MPPALVDEALLNRVRGDLARQQALQMVQVAGHVFRVREISECHGRQLFGRVARQPAHGRVDTQPTVVQPEMNDANGGVFKRRAKLFFAGTQRFFSAPALRDVVETIDGACDVAFDTLERNGVDNDRDSGTVGAFERHFLVVSPGQFAAQDFRHHGLRVRNQRSVW